MFKSILVPFDLSEPSQDAFQWAAHLSEKEKADVQLVHVLVHDKYLQASGLLPSQDNVLEKIQDKVEEQVDELLSDSEKKWLKDKLEVKIELGDPVKKILECIDQTKPDLVVIGTHGWTGLKHILLGSKAEAIIRFSESPVLVSRQTPTWPVKKVLIPVDFSEFSEEALLMASNFLGEGVEFELFHAIAAPDISFYAPHILEETRMTVVEEIQGNVKKELEEIKAKHSSLNLSVNYEVGPAADCVANRAKEIEADLIVIPTHGRKGLSHTLLGSVSESVVRYAPCSVLSFHPKED